MMCLLDIVVAWDDAHARCNVTNHRDTVSLLCSHGQLAAVYGIEYVAQAMAVHGALCDAAQARPRAGSLASVRSIEVHVLRLDTIETPLDIEAERTGGDSINVPYRFIMRSGACIPLTSRAAVVFDASVA